VEITVSFRKPTENLIEISPTYFEAFPHFEVHHVREKEAELVGLSCVATTPWTFVKVAMA